jgi:hypothetical protein
VPLEMWSKKPGLGSDILWQLSDVHEFHAAAVKHDLAYAIKRFAGIGHDVSSPADDELEDDFKLLAGASPTRWEEGEIRLFVKLARWWGSVRWPRKKPDGWKPVVWEEEYAEWKRYLHEFIDKTAYDLDYIEQIGGIDVAEQSNKIFKECLKRLEAANSLILGEKDDGTNINKRTDSTDT